MKPVRLLQATALLGIALCSTRHAHAQGAPLRVLGYDTTVPSIWIARPAEYTVGTGTSPGAQVVVYFFGQGQGGAAGPNMARRKAQFSARKDFVGFVRGLH